MVHPNSLKNLAPRFEQGNRANPGGKPKGARNALNASFLSALKKEFDENGADIVRRCAKEDPAAFVRVLAALLPKEVEITHAMEDVTDEQLDAAAATIRAIIDAQDHREGAGEAQGL